MKLGTRIPLLLLTIALLCVAVSAQTTTTLNIVPGGCRLLTHCLLFDTGYNLVWQEVPYTAGAPAFLWYDPVGECTPLLNPISSLPGDTTCSGVDANGLSYRIDLHLDGYRYYYRGGGGRGGGGAGWRYAITGGYVTLTR